MIPSDLESRASVDRPAEPDVQQGAQQARRVSRGRLTAREERALAAMRRVAWFFDARFTLPFTNIRFGLDPIIGLLPVGGDVAMGLVGVWMLIQARSLGISTRTRVRMGLNLIADVLIGLVPGVGDLGDLFFKAHLRNMKLVEDELARRGVHRSASGNDPADDS